MKFTKNIFFAYFISAIGLMANSDVMAESYELKMDTTRVLTVEKDPSVGSEKLSFYGTFANTGEEIQLLIEIKGITFVGEIIYPNNPFAGTERLKGRVSWLTDEDGTEKRVLVLDGNTVGGNGENHNYIEIEIYKGERTNVVFTESCHRYSMRCLPHSYLLNLVPAPYPKERKSFFIPASDPIGIYSNGRYADTVQISKNNDVYDYNYHERFEFFYEGNANADDITMNGVFQSPSSAVGGIKNSSKNTNTSDHQRVTQHHYDVDYKTESEGKPGCNIKLTAYENFITLLFDENYWNPSNEGSDNYVEAACDKYDFLPYNEVYYKVPNIKVQNGEVVLRASEQMFSSTDTMRLSFYGIVSGNKPESLALWFDEDQAGEVAGKLIHTVDKESVIHRIHGHNIMDVSKDYNVYYITAYDQDEKAVGYLKYEYNATIEKADACWSDKPFFDENMKPLNPQCRPAVISPIPVPESEPKALVPDGALG